MKGVVTRRKEVTVTLRFLNIEANRKMIMIATYDYTVEVKNRFKGLDLIECLINDGQRFVTLNWLQGSRSSPWKRNAKKQNGCLRRPYKQL